MSFSSSNAADASKETLNIAKNSLPYKVMPRDSLVIQSLLKDIGVAEHEPRVINQLLEFTYRYISTVLDDALIFSQYANKQTIDLEDIRLAIQLQVDRMFTSPPPRDLLLEIARYKNNQPLPLIKSHAGPRPPPVRYSLVKTNYKSRNASLRNN